MSESIVERAEAYAQSHTDIRQAFIDGYNFGLKSRTKKKELDLSFAPEEFIPVLSKWFEYKKERKSPYTQRGAESAYKKLYTMSGGNPVVADEIVEQSIANNWQGLFELKNGTTSAIATTQSNRTPGPQSVAGRRESVENLANLAGAILRGTPNVFDK